MPALTFNVPAELEAAVSEAARKHMISKSAFLRLFLTEHVQQVKTHRIIAFATTPTPKRRKAQSRQ